MEEKRAEAEAEGEREEMEAKKEAEELDRHLHPENYKHEGDWYKAEELENQEIKNQAAQQAELAAHLEA